MKIVLAGFNVDESLIKQLPNQTIATPEVISAAYARISRSKKNVTELRAEAQLEIDKTRASNETILYEMGHGSIAEHAVFNFDLIGVSRYITEFIQKSRLASFTEKSQRYVTLNGDYVTPQEILKTPLEKEFNQIIDLQVALYKDLYEKAKSLLQETDFEGSKRDLQSRAKEDARYFLALATETQMGMTINARNLERLLRRLDKSGLEEAFAVRESILAQVQNIAPSIIKYTKTDVFESQRLSLESIENKADQDVALISYEKDGDDKILTSLLYEHTDSAWNDIKNTVQNMGSEEKREWFAKAFENLKSYHSMPRAFETVHSCFEVVISASCFAQLKRHRMGTVLRTDYQPDFGLVIPDLLRDLIDEEALDNLVKKTNSLYIKLKAINPLLGNYILMNANKLRVLLTFNMRELYHFARLRSDQHAQWEIRELSDKIVNILKDKYPLSAGMMCGKHQF